MLPRLSTERTLSRLAEPSDAPKILEYFRHAGQRYDPPLPAALLTLEHWQMHTIRLLQEHVTGASCRFFVFSPDETHIMGTIALSHITRGVRFDCSLSYAISAAYEGQGVMREAVQAAIQYAFDELGLHRIEAAHATENAGSARLLARLGFETVGTIPEYLYTGERWRDSILCTLVNSAWKAPGKGT